MADENKVREHAFDGISEYDNDLPRWWLNLLWATVLWAGCYVAWHVAGGRVGALELADDNNAALAKQASGASGPLPEGVLRVLSHEGPRQAHGKELFAKSQCTTCHGPDATGLVGPNLRDDYWIYGSDMETIVDTIANGRNNGLMPPQAKNLSRQEIIDLAVFIAGQNRDAKAPGKPADEAREKMTPITY